MPSKYDAINKLKAENPALTWTQAANQAGFPGEWTSYKGKAKPRTGDARGQARRRAKFDQPSTEIAGYEAKRLQQESTRISAEAEMFGLESTQIEHLADQEDVRNLTAGSGGDPTNKAIVKQTEARFKDRVKQLAPRNYSVTLNPTTDSVRVISNKFFDPIADPTTLPGVDIPIGSNIEEGLAKLNRIDRVEPVNGGIRFRRGAAMAATPAPVVNVKPSTPIKPKATRIKPNNGQIRFNRTKPVSPLNRGSAAYGGIETQTNLTAENTAFDLGFKLAN
jgi:hypothetical protein